MLEPIPIPTSTEEQPPKPEGKFNKWLTLETLLNYRYEFRRNLVSRVPEFRDIDEKEWQEVTDGVINSILRNLHHDGYTFVSEQLLVKVIQSDYAPAFHPIKEYFYRLPKWDGQTDYIRQLSDTLICTVQQETVYRFLRKWLACVVANALVDSDCKNHLCLVIAGKQGGFKSTWLSHLLPHQLEGYMSENFLDPEDKDSLIASTQNLFLNMDDFFADINGRKINGFKAFLTLPHVKIRFPYARFVEKRPKCASFFGSTNEEEFLFDETGTRRFLCFRTDRIDIAAALKVDMDMVYAQAKAVFEAGSYWITKEEEDMLEGMNDAFKVRSFEMELLIQHFYKPTGVPEVLWTTSEITNYLQAMTRKPIGKKRVGTALSLLGYERQSRRVENIPVKVYGLNRVYTDTDNSFPTVPPPVKAKDEPNNVLSDSEVAKIFD